MSNSPVTQNAGPAGSVTRYLPALFFLGCLIVGFAANLMSSRTFHLDRPAVRDVLSGVAGTDLESDLDENLPYRDFAISAWATAEYLVFGKGRDGVLVGRDGWLYSDEEFAFYPDETSLTGANLGFVQDVVIGLREREIQVVIAIIPAKTRVYGENLGRHSIPTYTLGRYTDIHDELRAAGLVAPDLLKVLSEAKAEAPTFLRTDTHWTPFGAAEVARALSQASEEAFDLSGFPETEFETVLVEVIDHRGDLLNFLPLGPWEALGPRPDRLNRFTTKPVESAGGLSLFGDPDIPIVMVGSSYSANALWNFEGALKQAFGIDVLNVADEGRGPFLPMRDYLGSAAFLETPPRLIIWEIPERFVPVSYDLEGGAAPLP